MFSVFVHTQWRMEFSSAAGLGAVLVLVLANAFFVATEFAIVAVRRSRLQELADEHVAGAAAAQQVVSHLDAYIAATQFGITLASLALGWIGEPALAGIIEPALAKAGIAATTGVAHGISIGVAFFVITGLHIVIGELAPKGLALQKPETTALWVARPIQLFYIVFKWPVTVLNGVGNATLGVLGLNAAAGHELVHSVDELRVLVAGMQQAGVVDTTEALIAKRAFDFSDVTATAIMTPRTEIEAVSSGWPVDKLLQTAENAHHSRLPVYDGSVDNIIGVLHLRQLLKHDRHSPASFDLHSLLEVPLFVPETRHATDLLSEMRQHRTHLAVIVDEYGGTAGIVTSTDLLQTLVGRLDDRGTALPRDTGQGRAPDDASVVLDGLMRISEFEELTGTELSRDYPGIETLGGWITAALGRVPRSGDRVEIAGRSLTVETLDGFRVERIRVIPSARATD